MDACLGVEREVVKVLDKFTNLRDQNVGCIDDIDIFELKDVAINDG